MDGMGSDFGPRPALLLPSDFEARSLLIPTIMIAFHQVLRAWF